MAKSQRLRGERGIQGPPGPSGPQGVTGDTGATGAKGERGPAGKSGLMGSAAITADDRMQILSIVEGQIEEVYHELAVQTKRMGQLQAQVDEVRTQLHGLMGAGEG